MEKLPQKIGWASYRHQIQNLKLIPNFWTSPDYLRAAGFDFFLDQGWIWVAEKDSPEIAFLPPLPLTPSFSWKNFPVIQEIWSDFGPSFLSEIWRSLGFSSQFLDWEYWYDPIKFKMTPGGRWALYRKNVRKWARRNEGACLEYCPVHDPFSSIDVLIEWLSSKEKESIEDSLTLEKYLPQIPNERMWGLYRDKELIGINAWDIGLVINFRYSFCIPEPFLASYLRNEFYSRHDFATLVNDGGVLDKPGLEFFKDKMNPEQKRTISTWKRS